MKPQERLSLPLDHPVPGTPASLDEPWVQPYYVRDPQRWAIDQERQRHNEALYSFGEYAMFVLMWSMEDLEAKRVRRCPLCWGVEGTDSVQAAIAATYQQPTQAKCPECFGTTFEGGYRARIIRPAIFSDTDEDQQRQARGVVNPQDLSIESTTDFRVRSGDFVFRATGDRYQLRVPDRVTLRTGFAVPHQSTSAVGYNHARANQEDPTSVAYLIPPDRTTVTDLLTRGSRSPYDFAEFEVIRSSLIPKNDD